MKRGNTWNINNTAYILYKSKSPIVRSAMPKIESGELSVEVSWEEGLPNPCMGMKFWLAT